MVAGRRAKHGVHTPCQHNENLLRQLPLLCRVHGGYFRIEERSSTGTHLANHGNMCRGHKRDELLRDGELNGVLVKCPVEGHQLLHAQHIPHRTEPKPISDCGANTGDNCTDGDAQRTLLIVDRNASSETGGRGRPRTADGLANPPGADIAAVGSDCGAATIDAAAMDAGADAPPLAVAT